MKKMSPKEFQKYCEQQKFNSYVYASDNQSYTKRGYAEIHLIFNSLHINLFPKMLLFTNNSDTMQLNCVKQIIVKEDCAIGSICTIVCGHNDDKTGEKTYVFIANWQNF